MIWKNIEKTNEETQKMDDVVENSDLPAKLGRLCSSQLLGRPAGMLLSPINHAKICGLLANNKKIDLFLLLKLFVKIKQKFDSNFLLKK